MELTQLTSGAKHVEKIDQKENIKEGASNALMEALTSMKDKTGNKPVKQAQTDGVLDFSVDDPYKSAFKKPEEKPLPEKKPAEKPAEKPGEKPVDKLADKSDKRAANDKMTDEERQIIIKKKLAMLEAMKNKENGHPDEGHNAEKPHKVIKPIKPLEDKKPATASSEDPNHKPVHKGKAVF